MVVRRVGGGGYDGAMMSMCTVGDLDLQTTPNIPAAICSFVASSSLAIVPLIWARDTGRLPPLGPDPTVVRPFNATYTDLNAPYAAASLQSSPLSSATLPMGCAVITPAQTDGMPQMSPTANTHAFVLNFFY